MKPVFTAMVLMMCIATSHMSTAKSNLPPIDTRPVTGEIAVSNVSIKAVRDFMRLYRNVQYVKWYKTSAGYTASFDEERKNIKVVYDLNGTRLYTIISYTEKMLDYIC